MYRRTKYFGIVIALICLGAIIAACSQASANGEIEVVKSFEAANLELPEGIAIDKTGNMYVSLGIPGFARGNSGEIWKISPDGTETVLAEFDVPPAAGLAVDASGNGTKYVANILPETGSLCGASAGTADIRHVSSRQSPRIR